jgi:hypothetical protein
MQALIKLFQRMFGEGLAKNIVICFTRWDFQIRSKKKQSAKMTMEEMILAYRKKLNELYGFNLSSDQFIFIDNSLDEDD